MGADRYTHGVSGYTHGCRCGICRAGTRRAQDRYRRRRAVAQWQRGDHLLRVDSTGTRRRLQALYAAGWQSARVATEAGMTEYQINAGRKTRPGSYVFESTARRVRDTFDRLAIQPFPEHPNAERLRKRGAAEGWALPLQWDDDQIDDPHGRPARLSRNANVEGRAHHIDPIAIERALAGDPPARMTRSEIAEANRLLIEQGHTASWIAQCLGCSERNVVRHISKARVAS